MSESDQTARGRGKFYLRPLAEGGSRRSHAEPPRFKNEVRFVLPGTRKKATQPDEVIQFDSSGISQPFLDPDVLDRWQREHKTKS